MNPHVCRESKECICWHLSLEPAERCPLHGAGEWPPRCGECGRFMDRDLVNPELREAMAETVRAAVKAGFITIE